MRRTALLLAIAATVVASGCSSTPSRPHPASTSAVSPSVRSGAPTPTSTGTATTPAYLALGDSVPFGFRFNGDASRPASFTGYPELAATRLHLPVTNASCPGETSGSFISADQPSVGCRAWRVIGRLHVSYAGSQLEFATGFLRAHPRTALVSITIGGNDLLRCAARGAAECAAQGRFAKTLDDYATNLRAIVTAIRRVYRGPLVAVTYYATDYRNAREVTALGLLNARTAQVVTAAGGQVADGLAAFRAPAMQAGGDACAAHLLALKADGSCDIHPSPRGAELLAEALERVYTASR